MRLLKTWTRKGTLSTRQNTRVDSKTSALSEATHVMIFFNQIQVKILGITAVDSRASLGDRGRHRRSLAHVLTPQPKKSAVPRPEFASSTGAATQDAPKQKSTKKTAGGNSDNTALSPGAVSGLMLC